MTIIPPRGTSGTARSSSRSRRRRPQPGEPRHAANAPAFEEAPAARRRNTRHPAEGPGGRFADEFDDVRAEHAEPRAGAVSTETDGLGARLYEVMSDSERETAVAETLLFVRPTFDDEPEPAESGLFPRVTLTAAELASADLPGSAPGTAFTTSGTGFGASETGFTTPDVGFGPSETALTAPSALFPELAPAAFEQAVDPAPAAETILFTRPRNWGEAAEDHRATPPVRREVTPLTETFLFGTAPGRHAQEPRSPIDGTAETLLFAGLARALATQPDEVEPDATPWEEPAAPVDRGGDGPGWDRTPYAQIVEPDHRIAEGDRRPWAEWDRNAAQPLPDEDGRRGRRGWRKRGPDVAPADFGMGATGLDRPGRVVNRKRPRPTEFDRNEPAAWTNAPYPRNSDYSRPIEYPQAAGRTGYPQAAEYSPDADYPQSTEYPDTAGHSWHDSASLSGEAAHPQAQPDAGAAWNTAEPNAAWSSTGSDPAWAEAEPDAGWSTAEPEVAWATTESDAAWTATESDAAWTGTEADAAWTGTASDAGWSSTDSDGGSVTTAAQTTAAAQAEAQAEADENPFGNEAELSPGAEAAWKAFSDGDREPGTEIRTNRRAKSRWLSTITGDGDSATTGTGDTEQPEEAPKRRLFLLPVILRCLLYLGPLSVAIAGVGVLGRVAWPVPAAALLFGWAAAQALTSVGVTVARLAGPEAAVRLIGAGFAAVTALWCALVWVAPASLLGPDRLMAASVGAGGLVTLATVTAALVSRSESAVIRWYVPCWLLAGAALAGQAGASWAHHVPVETLLPAAVVAVLVRAFRPAVLLGRECPIPRLTAVERRRGLAYLVVGASQALCVALLWRSGPGVTPALVALPLLLAIPMLEALIGWHTARIDAGLDSARTVADLDRHVRNVTVITLAGLLPPLAAGGALALAAYQLPYQLSHLGTTQSAVLALAAGTLLGGVFAITFLLAARSRTGIAATLSTAPPLATVALPLLPQPDAGPLPLAVAVLAATHVAGLLIVALTAADLRRTP
ncbi:hypothetical protein [Actinoplanes sp. HUAS TT8]|uniref:hypothetical protein n=1 Tax=Actinoplanes sp. HUAS TT8 TaxID=3447453 RepID=UPI003F51F0A4